MDRLTSNKEVSEMSMHELAYNGCYSKNGEARYRDFGKDISARDYARNLITTYCDVEDSEIYPSDDIFDEVMHDTLMIGATENIQGLIALFYRNLWAMADLHTRLKEYEDAEEQGKLLRLPISVGNTVYTNIGTRYLRKKDRPYKVKVVFIGLNGSEEDSFINVKYSNDYVYGFKFSDLGEKWFLTQEEAEAKLEEMRGAYGKNV